MLELVSLLLKIVIGGLIIFVLMTYLFGVTRNLSLNMQPAFQDGDLVFFYRIDHRYAAGDVIVVKYQERQYLERVVAVAGDTVDITEDGLVINGSVVQELYKRGETTMFEEGVTFPLTVPQGKIFVLGDNREYAVDSRIFGCVNIEDVSGKVMGLFRRRNF